MQRLCKTVAAFCICGIDKSAESGACSEDNCHLDCVLDHQMDAEPSHRLPLALLSLVSPLSQLGAQSEGAELWKVHSTRKILRSINMCMSLPIIDQEGNTLTFLSLLL